MKFEIKRASGKEPPYESAKKLFSEKRWREIWLWKDDYPYDLEKMEYDISGWRNSGRNHKEEGNCLIKEEEYDYTTWYIEIETLEEIMELVAQAGDIIIKAESCPCDFPAIVIYDDYLE